MSTSHHVHIQSDESGMVKMVEFNGKALPVLSFELEADANNPVALASLVMHVTVDMTAKVGQVKLVCPICEEGFTHQCYDNPPEEEYDQDPKY